MRLGEILHLTFMFGLNTLLIGIIADNLSHSEFIEEIRKAIREGKLKEAEVYLDVLELKLKREQED